MLRISNFNKGAFMQQITTNKKKHLGIEFIEEVAYAFQKSKTLLTACDFDIFNIIGDTGYTSEKIAEKIGTNPRATERLLNALVALEFLEKKDMHYYNSEETLSHLVHGGSEFIGNLEHIAGTWDTWSHLSETIKTGKPIHYKSLDEKDEKWIENFASAAFWRSSLEAPGIVKLINLKNVRKVLDLGGGKGAFAYEFAKAVPDIHINIFDIPQITKYADQNIVKWELQDKISTTSGNFMTDDIGKGYDMIFISQVLQLNSIWDNVKLLQKCFDAMNYGGTIVINEMIIDDQRTSPLSHTMFSLNMLVNTLTGDAFTETDIWIMLREAWFREIKQIKTPYETSLMIGVR